MEDFGKHGTESIQMEAVCLSVCLSVCLYVCMYVCLSVNPPVSWTYYVCSLTCYTPTVINNNLITETVSGQLAPLDNSPQTTRPRSSNN